VGPSRPWDGLSSPFIVGGSAVWPPQCRRCALWAVSAVAFALGEGEGGGGGLGRVGAGGKVGISS